jgi:translation initiation factor eIF-2B subunit delta
MRVLKDIVIESKSLDVQSFEKEIESAVQAILVVMPAYAPPINAICRVITCLDTSVSQGESLEEIKTKLIKETESYLSIAEIAAQKIEQYSTELICPGMTVYTHTLSETVMRALTATWNNGVQYRVMISESQPNCDGLDTARQLANLGIEVRFGIDAAMGDLVSHADLMLTGTEAITPHGSAICKIGTYLAALTARENGVPYFVLADTQKFIPSFVTDFFSISNQVTIPALWADRDVGGFELNTQLFDETPARLITGVVTEQGIISPMACGMITFNTPTNDRLFDLLVNAGILVKSSIV